MDWEGEWERRRRKKEGGGGETEKGREGKGGEGERDWERGTENNEVCNTYLTGTICLAQLLRFASFR